MKISTKGRYALRLMLDLAQSDPEKFVALKEVAERQEISIKYLEQIITLLCKVGYIKSLRGSQGGYKLAKAPIAYTVGDILRVTEGDLAPVSCLQDEVNHCSRFDQCRTIGFWSGLYDKITEYVDGTTLEDLAGKEVDLN